MTTDADRARLRAELLARRAALPASQRAQHDAAITGRLEALLSAALAHRPGAVLAFCWPHRGEFDARELVRAFIARGGRAALPVVVARHAPLAFRRWSPDSPMEAGAHGIAVPAHDEPAVPNWLLLPVVGFDEAGYRLGYGGGYFDRTLAQRPSLVPVGVSYELARLPSIGPRPHDVSLPVMITEAGAFVRDGKRLRAAEPPELVAQLTG